MKACEITDISNSVGLPHVKIPRKTIRKRGFVQVFGQNCASPKVRRGVYFDSKGLVVVLRHHVNKVDVCLSVCLSVCVCSVAYTNNTFAQNEHYLEYKTNPCQRTNNEYRLIYRQSSHDVLFLNW